MSKRPDRLYQIILIVSFLGFSWLAMQAVHELGHVLGALATGGEVDRVVLHPLTISRTDVSPNPNPLLVAWAGPVVGVVVPLAAFALAGAARMPCLFLFRFFAGFCLIANGAYIGAGAFVSIGDAGDMLRHGAEPWHLILFGLMTLPAGLSLWHRQGRHFGLGETNGEVSTPAAMVSLALFALTVAAVIVIDSR